MKEKAKKVFDWLKTRFSKIGKKTIVCVSVVIILGVAVMLNFLLFNKAGEQTGNGLDLSVNLSDVSGSVTEAPENNSDAAAGDDYFVSMALSRRQARDESMEVLKSVAESASAIDEMKNEALDDIAQIAKDIESEANIESLLKAKGFEDCIAVISEGSANIVVASNGLLASDVAQISEIVYQEAGILPANLKIIEKAV